MMPLSPIGKGSSADDNGYNFDLLLGWLESIRDSELEKAETKPAYRKRADKLSDLVDGLQDLSGSSR